MRISSHRVGFITRNVLIVLACLPIVALVAWFVYLVWNVYWRINCQGEDCYFAEVVISIWLVKGAVILPFAVAGIVTLLWLTRVRVMRASDGEKLKLERQ